MITNNQMHKLRMNGKLILRNNECSEIGLSISDEAAKRYASRYRVHNTRYSQTGSVQLHRRIGGLGNSFNTCYNFYFEIKTNTHY